MADLTTTQTPTRRHLRQGGGRSRREPRGTTTIPAQVVARVAEQAASELAYVGSAAGGLLGIGARREFRGRPDASCDLYGTTAVLRLDVGMTFPIPLREATEQLREHVRARVEQLTGFNVSRIDIDISWLDPSSRVRGRLR
ncbi:Asp23/Gls24 family envelope stress response protein [Actinomyces weissii]|uniref:Asp23/Gls24 family envelope stress response protein n=1 Tax=Actinomyces weissii TaxID=675090 RepID=A0A7T7M9I2_9ACTO|nr:Asp23/Gls24 family envelope stress response protein [Actinomyces weissii]QQM67401.1 Asp23/Gls24 family envelope stress response protein [Actinomyces weissii]